MYHNQVTSLIASLIFIAATTTADATDKLDYSVSWLGNSFSGADGKWVQNFFIHMNTRPDGTCYAAARIIGPWCKIIDTC